METATITPFDKEEFDIAFSLLKEFGKDRNLLSLEEDEEIGFAFLMKEKEDAREIAGKVDTRKPAR